MKYSLVQSWTMRHLCRKMKRKKTTYNEISKVINKLGHGHITPDEIRKEDHENKWSEYGFEITTGVSTIEKSLLIKNQKLK